MAKKSDQDVVPTSSPIAAPKLQYRDQIAMDHHLFKGVVANCIRSDKWGPIKVKSIEHVHFFHSVSSDGSAQKHSNAVAGHVHEWEYGFDTKTGEPWAKCGPPLKRVVKPGPNGMTRVVYERIRVRNAETGEWIDDTHLHPMIYMGSDKLSPEKIQSIQQANASRIGSPQGVKVHEDPKSPDGYDMRDSDGNRAQE